MNKANFGFNQYCYFITISALKLRVLMLLLDFNVVMKLTCTNQIREGLALVCAFFAPMCWVLGLLAAVRREIRYCYITVRETHLHGR